MLIDTKRTVLRTQVRRMLTLFGLIIAACLIIYFMPTRMKILGLGRVQIVVVMVVLYLVSSIIESRLELNYIYFRSDARSIVLRYFSMSIFNKQKNSIEIAADAFRGYEIQESFWGRKKKLVLFEQIKDKVAKYHPVSLSGLNKRELGQLLHTLDSLK